MSAPAAERAVRASPPVVVAGVRIVPYARVESTHGEDATGVIVAGRLAPVALRVETAAGVRWLDLDGNETKPLE